MIQAIPQQVTFDEFIAWYPEDSAHRYELHDGVIVEMPKPTGHHSRVAGFILDEINFQIRQRNLSCFIPRESIVKPDDDRSGYEPDIIVLDKSALRSEPRWKKESVITQGSSVWLVVEVVSQNWRDDYLKKLADYEAMGIAEYWIVDYLGIGASRYTGNPKEPTFSIYQLNEAKEYQVIPFRGTQQIESKLFPDLVLTIHQIAAVAAENDEAR